MMMPEAQVATKPLVKRLLKANCRHVLPTPTVWNLALTLSEIACNEIAKRFSSSTGIQGEHHRPKGSGTVAGACHSAPSTPMIQHGANAVQPDIAEHMRSSNAHKHTYFAHPCARRHQR
eukprot:6179002-Pleurochrysis_carterae.AAC.8